MALFRVLVLAASLSGPVAAMAQDKLVIIGELVFNACYPCHLVGEAKIKKAGPNLNGLFGRNPGRLPDFEYSPAMVAFGQNHTWDEATLISYLRDTQQLVPGNRMKHFAFKKDDEIQALLAYLATFDSEGMTAE